MDDQNQQDVGAGSPCPPKGEVTSPLQEQCEEYLAGWKRAQADYQNLKKDTEREKTEYVKFANEGLLHDLLPALDQFRIALQHVPKLEELPSEKRAIWENWLKGLRAVQTLWEQAATSIGLERIPVEGHFDPSLHDAAGEEEIEGQAADSIIRMVQDGWRLHGKVLRPARVIIAK